MHEDYLELEGYGSVKLAEGFRVLKTYGQFEEKSLKDILVGYDMQEFVVAEGQVCAALITRSFNAETIRVLLKTSDFQESVHPSVQLLCENTMTMTVGTVSQTIPAGELVEITADRSTYFVIPRVP